MAEPPEAHIRSYARAAQRRSVDALREMAEVAAGVREPCAADWFGGVAEGAPLFCLVLDNAGGRLVEDALHAYAPELIPRLRSPRHCARLAGKGGAGEGLWSRWLDRTPGPAPAPAPPGCPFSAAALSEEQLQQHGYPAAASHAHFADTAAWPPGAETLPLLGLDCEMVQTVAGSQLARVACVDHELRTVYAALVRPEAEVTDYLPAITGLSAASFEGDAAKTHAAVLADLRRLVCAETVVVGHSLENDFAALRLVHRRVVDTAVLFAAPNGAKPSLRALMQAHFRVRIQSGTHHPDEDARAATALARFKLELLAHFAPKTGAFFLARRLAERGGLRQVDSCGASSAAVASAPDWRTALGWFAEAAQGRGQGPSLFCRLRLGNEPVVAGLRDLAQRLSALRQRAGGAAVVFATSTPQLGYDLLLLL